MTQARLTHYHHKMNILRHLKQLSLNLLMYKSSAVNQKGETLISVVLGAALVMFIVGAALSSTYQMLNGNKISSESPAICREVATNIVNVIRSNGTQAKMFKTPLGNNSINLRNRAWHSGEVSYNQDGVETENGVSQDFMDVRWPNARAVNWSGSGDYVSHTPRLIQSSINSLLPIYNTMRGACSNPKGVSLANSRALSDWATEAVIDNHSVQASLRIRPYNLRSGQLISCNSNLWIRPYAQDEPPRAVRFDVFDLSNYTPHRGLEIEVFVDVVDLSKQAEESETFSCSVKNRIQYDQMAHQPVRPDLAFDGSTVTVSFNSEREFSGSHLICRSSHQPGPFGASWAQGIGGRSATLLGPSGGWVPCTRLQMCGRSPNNVAVNDQQTRVDLSYSLPPFCMMNVQARVVDAVGNLSAISSASFYDGATSTSTSDSDGSTNGGYQVNDEQFSSLSAANQAAALTGQPVQTIDQLTQPPVDAMVRSAYEASQTAGNSASQAQGHATTAQGHATTAQGHAAGATSPTTGASSARASATSSRSAATSARGSATAAAAANASAQSANAQAQATAASNPNSPSAQAAADAAQEAADAAQAAADAAEAAARAAEAAARAAEQAAQDKEEAESNDDD